MKSPFTEFVVSLHKDHVEPKVIFELAQKEFKSSSICFYQVERVVDNCRKGLITETGEFIRGNH